MASPPGRRSSRDELLLRVYASWVVDAPTIIAILREAEARHASSFGNTSPGATGPWQREAPGPARSAGFADYATLRRGIGFERGRLAWVRWLIRQIEDDPEEDTAALRRRICRLKTDASGGHARRGATPSTGVCGGAAADWDLARQTRSNAAATEPPPPRQSVASP